MSRLLLMESLLGHLALLAEKYPEKAASAVAKRAKRVAKMTLKAPPPAHQGAQAASHRPLRRAA